MQRDNELARIVVEGTRTDDGRQCTVVLVRRTSGAWGFYPHGWGKFGVLLPDREARRVAQMILDGTA